MDQLWSLYIEKGTGSRCMVLQCVGNFFRMWLLMDLPLPVRIVQTEADTKTALHQIGGGERNMQFNGTFENLTT